MVFVGSEVIDFSCNKSRASFYQEFQRWREMLTSTMFCLEILPAEGKADWRVVLMVWNSDKILELLQNVCVQILGKDEAEGMLHREGRCHFGCSFLWRPFISASGSHPSLIKRMLSKKPFSKILLRDWDIPSYNAESISHGMNFQGKLILKAVEIPFQVFSTQFHNIYITCSNCGQGCSKVVVMLFYLFLQSWFSVL